MCALKSPRPLSQIVAEINVLAGERQELYRRWLAENTADPLQAQRQAAQRAVDARALESRLEKLWQERRLALAQERMTPYWEDRIDVRIALWWAWAVARPHVMPPDPALPASRT